MIGPSPELNVIIITQLHSRTNIDDKDELNVKQSLKIQPDFVSQTALSKPRRKKSMTGSFYLNIFLPFNRG